MANSQISKEIKNNARKKKNVNKKNIPASTAKKASIPYKALALENELEDTKKDLTKNEMPEEADRIQIKKLSKDLQDKEEQITALQEELKLAARKSSAATNTLNDITKVDYINSTYSSFHMELYPGDQDFRCKIKNIQTDDEALFIGINEKNIRNFLVKHLPKEEEILISKTVSEGSVPHGDTSLPATGTPLSHQLKTYCLDGEKAINSIASDQSFLVGIVTELKSDALKLSADIQTNISVYAKTLGKGIGLLIGKAQRTMIPTGKSLLKIQCNGLTRGTYKLEAAVNFSLPGGKKTPLENFTDSGYICVS